MKKKYKKLQEQYNTVIRKYENLKRMQGALQKEMLCEFLMCYEYPSISDISETEEIISKFLTQHKIKKLWKK